MAANSARGSESPNESDQAFANRINLMVVKRTDPLANRILFTADSSCLFEIVNGKQWEKREDIAGPLLVYERTGSPRYALMILSIQKKVNEEFLEYISPHMSFKVDDQMSFIVYATASSGTCRGLWIAGKEVCSQLQTMLNRLAEEVGAEVATEPKRSTSPPVNIMDMLSRAHKNFSAQKIDTTADATSTQAHWAATRSQSLEGNSPKSSTLTSHLTAILGLTPAVTTALATNSASPVAATTTAASSVRVNPVASVQTGGKPAPRGTPARAGAAAHSASPSRAGVRGGRGSAAVAVAVATHRGSLPGTTEAALKEQLFAAHSPTAAASPAASSPLPLRGQQVALASSGARATAAGVTHVTSSTSGPAGGAGGASGGVQTRPVRNGDDVAATGGSGGRTKRAHARQPSQGKAGRRASAPVSAYSSTQTKSSTQPISLPGYSQVRSIHETSPGGPHILRMKSYSQEDTENTHNDPAPAFLPNSLPAGNSFAGAAAGDLSTSAPGAEACEHLMRPCEFDQVSPVHRRGAGAAADVAAAFPAASLANTHGRRLSEAPVGAVHSRTHHVSMGAQSVPVTPSRPVDSGLREEVSSPAEQINPLTLEQFRAGLIALAQDDNFLRSMHQMYVESLHKFHSA